MERCSDWGPPSNFYIDLPAVRIMVKLGKLAALALAIPSFFGCVNIPSGLEPVTGFDVNRYMGTWYEIARLDHSFERGLSNVSAQYNLRDDGGIRVVNRGYNEESGEWEEIEGRGYFLGDKDVGSLKVAFFWPFYGGYHVITLDKEYYRYAMVAGPSRSYLWILSREGSLEPDVLDELVEKARRWGFDVEKLIYVNHNHPGG
jgi:apolipoprotein D and lipocalin family protein